MKKKIIFGSLITCSLLNLNSINYAQNNSHNKVQNWTVPNPNPVLKNESYFKKYLSNNETLNSIVLETLFQGDKNYHYESNKGIFYQCYSTKPNKNLVLEIEKDNLESNKININVNEISFCFEPFAPHNWEQMSILGIYYSILNNNDNVNNIENNDEQKINVADLINLKLRRPIEKKQTIIFSEKKNSKLEKILIHPQFTNQLYDSITYLFY